MRTEVSILHHDYPARLRPRVQAKLEPLSRFDGRLQSVTARLERENEDHHVELVANVGGSVLVADVRGDSFGKVLDEAVDRLASQLRRLHGKLVDRRHGRR